MSLKTRIKQIKSEHVITATAVAGIAVVVGVYAHTAYRRSDAYVYQTAKETELYAKALKEALKNGYSPTSL